MEENSSILINLCSQKYFRDIFSKSTKSFAFTTPSLEILWINDAFRKIFNDTVTLANFSKGVTPGTPYAEHIQLREIHGSLIFFPIIYQNQLLGYTTLFVQGKNENDIYELNAAKHDLNNLLTIVFNLLHLTDKDNLAGTGLGLAKDFLENYSLNVITKNEIVDIKDTLNILFDSFKGSLPDKIVFKSDISPDLHKIKINKTKLIRILSNIITNAIEAVPAGGQITLSANNIIEKGKNYACIIVKDNGRGIPANELKNIFNKDYSTKKRGSGLGLSIVKKLMDEFNSSITVKSNARAGTQFILKFPAVTGEKKNIALIEDEAAINELLTDLLSANYKVSSYLDGESFFSDKEVAAFDLIIIDKKLPGIDGIECIQNIRRKDRKVKIILASGSETGEKGSVKLPAIDRILNKPYKFDQLLSVVEELLA